MPLKVLQHSFQLRLYIGTGGRRCVVIAVKFQIDHGRKHPLKRFDSRNKVFSLRLSGTVIAEKVVCSHFQLRHLRLCKIAHKIRIRKRAALRCFNKGKTYSLLRQCLPIDFPLIGGYIHAFHTISLCPHCVWQQNTEQQSCSSNTDGAALVFLDIDSCFQHWQNHLLSIPAAF